MFQVSKPGRERVRVSKSNNFSQITILIKYILYIYYLVKTYLYAIANATI